MVGGEKGSSQKAVIAALFGNLAIAISKLVAAIFTGSSSMWAETLHSFSDTVNQILLFQVGQIWFLFPLFHFHFKAFIHAE